MLVSVGRGVAAGGVRYPALWFASSRWSSSASSALPAGPERGVMSDPGGGGEDGSAGLEVSAVQNVADVSMLQKHLRKLVPLLLEDGGEAPAALEAALEEKSALEQMRKFLSDPQVHTVLVERSTLKGAAPGRPFRVAAGGGRPRPAVLPQQWHRFVCRPQDGRVGWGRRLPAERGGRRPHPGLQCHMSLSVSIWVQAPGSGWEGGRDAGSRVLALFAVAGGRSWGSGGAWCRPGRRASRSDRAASPAPPRGGCEPAAPPLGPHSVHGEWLSPHFTREETEAPGKWAKVTRQSCPQTQRLGVRPTLIRPCNLCHAHGIPMATQG